MRLTNSEVRVETTNSCNAACIMCPREKMERLEGVMDMELFKSIVLQCRDLGANRIFLGGFGEPLLDPYLIERVRFVKNANMFVNFISNGSLWNANITETLISAGLDEVRFSFYGQNNEFYEKIHRGLSYNATRQNLHTLFEIRNNLGRKNPVALIYFLALEENRKMIESFRMEWEPIADFIEIWRPHNFGDGRNFRNVDSTHKKETCGRPENGPLQFQYDGTLIPCCYDYDGKMILGDIRKQSIPEILAGEAYQDLRVAHNKGDFSGHPYCENCDQLLERADALIYTNRHQLPPKEAVLLSNSNHFQLK